ncbi:MAG: hypothetical protein MK212_11950 [Saprospiraceae bacterium]|nr:hypothetical protein [Saprospiraceae bacterium]
MNPKIKKPVLIFSVVMLLSVAAYFLFFRKKAQAIPASQQPRSPLDYDYTIPEENQDGILPINRGGNGTRTKTLLANKEAFDGKVITIINQIMNGAPDNDWYQRIQESTAKFWTDEAGMEMNKAVYHHARVFIAQQYFYNPA